MFVVRDTVQRWHAYVLRNPKQTFSLLALSKIDVIHASLLCFAAKYGRSCKRSGTQRTRKAWEGGDRL